LRYFGRRGVEKRREEKRRRRMPLNEALLATINHFASKKAGGGGATSLANAFEDGVVLSQFVEGASGEEYAIPHAKPKFPIQKKQNISSVLDRLGKGGLAHGCDADSLCGGNVDQVIKLTWAVILKYHLKQADEGFFLGFVWTTTYNSLLLDERSCQER